MKHKIKNVGLVEDSPPQRKFSCRNSGVIAFTEITQVLGGEAGALQISAHPSIGKSLPSMGIKSILSRIIGSHESPRCFDKMENSLSEKRETCRFFA